MNLWPCAGKGFMAPSFDQESRFPNVFELVSQKQTTSSKNFVRKKHSFYFYFYKGSKRLVAIKQFKGAEGFR